MKLIHKLLLGFLAVILFFWIAGYFAINISKKILQESVLRESETLVIEILNKIDRRIHARIEVFQDYSQDFILQETVLKSNQEFEKLDNIQAYINKRDQEWISAPKKEETPFMQNVINNRLSEGLRQKIKFYKEKHGDRVFGEVFVTNKYGANVAQTGKTSDYRQDDEEWWQVAKKDGLYARDIEYDESADVYSTDIGIRIDDKNGNFIGALKVVLNIKEVINTLKGLKADILHKEHESMEYHLITKEGRLIYSSQEDKKFLEDVLYLLPGKEHLSPEHRHVRGSTSGHFINKSDRHGEEILVTHAHSIGYEDFKGFNWILVLRHKAEEVFAPVTEFRNRLFSTSLALTILGILIAYFVSISITKNIKKLQGATVKIGEGNLDTRIDIESNDEIGQLAKAFKQMTEDLKMTTVKRDELANEITEREKAEEALVIKDRAIESAIDAIGMIDAEANVNFVNPSFLKLWGYDDEKEVLGRSVFEFWKDKDKFEDVMETISDKGGWIGELAARRKDGTFFDVQVSAGMVRDNAGNLLCMMGSFLDITERKRTEETVQLQLERFNVLRFIDMTITSSLDLRVTLDILLIQVTKQLGIDAATVLLLNQHTQILEYVSSKGFRTSALKYTKLKLGESNAGRAALERRIVTIPNLKKEIDGFASSKLFTGEDFVTYFGVPLVAKGQTRGVLELFHRSPLSTDPEWLEFLETIADQAAMAIDNASLFDGLQRSNIDLTLAYDTTIEGWSRAMDLRDKETEGHTQRVAEMTLRIARELGIKEEELVHMRRGALLHDIGKMGIPDNILLKPERLTKKEWEMMKRHSEYAYDMLYRIEYLRPALDIPHYHHEKWDGTGYPKGLKGKEIPLAARMFAVADVWDALCSDRPYRPAWSKKKVREHIRSLAGTHFDPKVIEIFLKMEW